MFGGLGRWDFDEGAVRVTPRLTVSTAEAAIDAVVAGLGLTRVLSYQAVDALARGLRGAACSSAYRPRRNSGASALSGRRASAAEAARLHRPRGAELRARLGEIEQAVG